MEKMTPQEAFTPVLEWLDAGAPETAGFTLNMGYFQYTPADCGTTCCIAGALNQFNNMGISITTYHEMPIQEVAQTLGLTRGQAADLFYAGPNSDQGASYLPAGKFLDEVTPKGAAHAIRTFLAQGKCDWSKFDA